MALYTNLRELKSVLQIAPDDLSEDLTLNLYNSFATNIIEEYIGRDFTYKSRTQYYPGSGTQKLLLKNRPVYPNPSGDFSPLSVEYNTAGYFGLASGSFSSPSSRTFTLGVDYTLKIDQDDGGSRSAILYRIGDYWFKPAVRQAGLLAPFIGPDLGSYKITYTAGWSVDTLPGAFRMAADLLITRIRFIFPVGMEINSNSAEEISMSFSAERKDYLLALVKPLLFQYRNWRF